MDLVERIVKLDVYYTILSFLYIIGGVQAYYFGLNAVITLAVSSVTALALDFLLYSWEKRPVSILTLRKALITATLLAFLLPPEAPVHVTVMAAALAILSKHFLKLPGQSKHVFNPAALGAMVTGLVFSFPMIWWGAHETLTWILGIVLIYRFKRLELPATIIASYALLSMALNGFTLDSLQQSVLQNTPLVFMAFFMATEPMTSPNTFKGRMLFGAGIALAVFSLSFVGGFDALTAGLLAGNLLNLPINYLLKPKAV